MAWRGTVRVVLGEAAEPYPGPLRLALLGARIDVVGQASNIAELDRVLDGVHPEALVLDAQMGALAVLAARERSPGSGIVVVWPAGVSAEIADERVEPSRVVHELGPAVRRVARARVQPRPPV